MKQIRKYKTKFCEECNIEEIRATPSAIRCIGCAKKKDIIDSTTRQKDNLIKGLCRCGRERDSKFQNCLGCREQRKISAFKRVDKKSLQGKEYRIKLRTKVFLNYGNGCSCCGESHFEFLEIDHVGGWGKDHRDASGRRTSGIKLLNFIIKENFPPTFRLLCGSCHLSISYNGYCPHEKEREVIVDNKANLSI